MSVKELLERAVVGSSHKPNRKPENRVELDEELYNQALALLAKPEPCKTCGGSGRKKWTVTKDWPHEYTICPRCKGTGIEPEPEPTEFTEELREVANYESGRKVPPNTDETWNVAKLLRQAADLLDSQQAEIGRLKKEAKKAYFAIELMVPDNFTGLIKIPKDGQVYNHRAFWEMLFGKQALSEDK